MQKTSVFADFYCLPNKLALIGRSPGLRSVVPAGLACDRFIPLRVDIAGARLYRSIGAARLPGSMVAADAKISLHGVAIYHPAKGKHLTRVGAEDDVTYVDCALQGS